MPSRPKWRSFEEVVAGIQALFTPIAEVKHNELITDRLGHKRQFDVVVYDVWGGRPILRVLECKDLNKRVGTPEIDAFKAKCDKVRANIKGIVSRKGFTRPDLEAAEHEGIGALSLLPNDPNEAGFAIGFQSFVELYKWKTFRMTMHFSSKKPLGKKFDPRNVKKGGKPVVNWFLKKLVTDLAQEEKEGWLSVNVTFDTPRIISVDGVNRRVNGITFSALRTKAVKTRFMNWSGSAFFDWSHKKILWPSKGQLVAEPIDTEFSDWEDYEGEVPDWTKQCGIEFRLKAFGGTGVSPDDDVIDLLAL